MARKLSHLDSGGNARMADVSDKPATSRSAAARVVVRMNAAARTALQAGTLKKGDALAVARVAGILAAKKTAELIPLCHTLALSDVGVDFAWHGDDLEVHSHAACVGPTGVEMEALTAAAVAALSIYDMCKAVDRAITIDGLHLIEKSGGRSGRYRAPA